MLRTLRLAQSWCITVLIHQALHFLECLLIPHKLILDRHLVSFESCRVLHIDMLPLRCVISLTILLPRCPNWKLKTHGTFVASWSFRNILPSWCGGLVPFLLYYLLQSHFFCIAWSRSLFNSLIAVRIASSSIPTHLFGDQDILKPYELLLLRLWIQILNL